MKNKLQRLLSVLLVVCLLLAVMPAVLADEAENDALTAFVEAGYIIGNGEGYAVENVITRAELATLINRVAGLTENTADLSAYTDVVEGAWYTEALGVALTAGYISAVEEGQIAPAGTVSAEEVQNIIITLYSAYVELEETEAITRGAVIEALAEAIAEEEAPEVAAAGTYVLMNIPYADFYAAEVENDVAVDGMTSATCNKPLMGTGIAKSSYHVNADGTDVTGITFPVLVGEGVDLSGYVQVTDKDAVAISYSARGSAYTYYYIGADSLFQNESYAYYVLTEEPTYYKEVTVAEDGSLVFGEIVGMETVELVFVAEPEYDESGSVILAEEEVALTVKQANDTTYGDLEIDVTSEIISNIYSNGNIYAVIITTAEGNDYGLIHVENIWIGVKLAWDMGGTGTVHGCPTNSAHYKAMVGQTITSITYITSEGEYVIGGLEIYVEGVEEVELMSEEQQAELEALLEQGQALLDEAGEELTTAEANLKAHLGEIEELLAAEEPTSAAAEDLLDEVPGLIEAVVAERPEAEEAAEEAAEEVAEGEEAAEEEVTEEEAPAEETAEV